VAGHKAKVYLVGTVLSDLGLLGADRGGIVLTQSGPGIEG